MAPEVGYDRQVMVDVLVYHYRRDGASCGCGWSELGRSHPEHVADVYEQSMAAREPETGTGSEHDVDVEVYTEYLPGGEITLARAACSCGWSTGPGDESAVRDAARLHGDGWCA